MLSTVHAHTITTSECMYVCSVTCGWDDLPYDSLSQASGPSDQPTQDSHGLLPKQRGRIYWSHKETVKGTFTSRFIPDRKCFWSLVLDFGFIWIGFGFTRIK